MAKSSTAKGPKPSASRSKTKSSAPSKRTKSSGGSSKSQNNQPNSAADALVKLIESPLVSELLAIGASAALASLAAGRFGRGDGQGTRRALKTAAKSAATAMGTRLATEVDEIRKASTRSREGAEA